MTVYCKKYICETGGFSWERSLVSTVCMGSCWCRTVTWRTVSSHTHTHTLMPCANINAHTQTHKKHTALTSGRKVTHISFAEGDHTYVYISVSTLRHYSNSLSYFAFASRFSHFCCVKCTEINHYCLNGYGESPINHIIQCFNIQNI